MIRTAAAVLALTALLFAGSPASAQTETSQTETSEVVLQLARHARGQLPAVLADYGAQSPEPLVGSPGTYLVLVDAEEAMGILMAMRLDDRITYAEPNFELVAPERHQFFFWQFFFWGEGDPTLDAQYRDQAATQTLGLDDGHAVGTGQGITVAVLDTGVDATHPVLAPHLVAGYDFVDDDTDPSEVADGIDNDGNGLVDEAYGHGTNVAGLVQLAAPDAKIMPVRVLDSDGTGNEFDIARAILWAADNGADVINLSLGTVEDSDLLDDIVDDVDDDVVVVAAAGNLGDTTEMYPAADDDAVGVTSVNDALQLSAFAGRGDWVDLAAPGEHIFSTHPDGRMVEWDGTSAATPLASGMAALALSVVEDVPEDPADLLKALGRSVDAQNPDWVGATGAGVPHGGELGELADDDGTNDDGSDDDDDD